MKMANNKEPENKKSFMIRVRVTEEEHEEFVKRARENGYRSVSEYIRSLIADDYPEEISETNSKYE